MIELKLNPGDQFLAYNSKWLQPIIKTVQKFWSKDNKAIYGHAGIILDSFGTTYESLWRVKTRNLYKEYEGKKVLIARYNNMTISKVNSAMMHIRNQHDNDFYPVYRFLFFAFPPLARVSSNKLVCSELVAKFLWYCGIMEYYNGVNPDDLHDEYRKTSGWTIIYEGIL